MDCEGKWKTLPLNENIAKTWHLAGVEFQGRIVVFGGVSCVSYNMYTLSEEGELLDDLSADPLVPGFMVRGSVAVTDGKIYAVGHMQLSKQSKWRIEVFDGSQWSLI